MFITTNEIDLGHYIIDMDFLYNGIKIVNDSKHWKGQKTILHNDQELKGNVFDSYYKLTDCENYKKVWKL